MEDENRNCPIINKIINQRDCFDVQMVIQDGAPEHTALKEIINNKEYKKICRNCKYYRED